MAELEPDAEMPRMGGGRVIVTVTEAEAVRVDETDMLVVFEKETDAVILDADDGEAVSV